MLTIGSRRKKDDVRQCTITRAGDDNSEGTDLRTVIDDERFGLVPFPKQRKCDRLVAMCCVFCFSVYTDHCELR
jgi:hypothetical protein